MERLRSRTKSMMVFMDGPRKSIVERAPKPEPIDPQIAAGGLAPCPAARAKIAMLPTASSMPTTGEGLSGIFASKDAGNTFAESMSRAPPLHGRRSISALAMSSHNNGDSDGQLPRSASAMDGGDATPHLPWLSEPTNTKKYKEHTVNEYHRVMNDFQQIKWGGLGANDSDEKKRARATRQRVLDYGKCVSQLNVQIIKQASPEDHQGNVASSSQPIPRKLTKEGELARLKRERALQFADQLWVRPDGQPAHGNGRKSVEPQSGVVPAPSSQSPARRGNHVMIPGPQLVEELHALEGRHREDYDRILSIKRQLGIQKAALPQIHSSLEGPSDGNARTTSREEVIERFDDSAVMNSAAMDDSPHSNAGGKLPAFLREDYREDDDDDVMAEAGGNQYQDDNQQAPQHQSLPTHDAAEVEMEENEEQAVASHHSTPPVGQLSRHSSQQLQHDRLNNEGNNEASQHTDSLRSPLQREASSSHSVAASNDRHAGDFSPTTFEEIGNEQRPASSGSHHGDKEQLPAVDDDGELLMESSNPAAAQQHELHRPTSAPVTDRGSTAAARDADAISSRNEEQEMRNSKAASPTLSHTSLSSAYKQLEHPASAADDDMQ
jgi:hypothetical protein